MKGGFQVGLNKRKKAGKSRGTFNIVHKSSDFGFVEAYKSLRTNLSFLSVNNKYKKIVLTSANSNEGKTNVSINLAISLAENGDKVLLIDADLRKPRISSYLHIENGKQIGLTSVLSGAAQLNKSIVRFTDLNIDVIPSGAIPPNPAELLGSDVMGELIKTLESAYDYIIFDTPPAAVVTDSAALSKYCDGVIMVIKQNYSTVEQINEAKRNLENVNANIIGSILNDYESKSRFGYGGYKYGYKYGYSCRES